MTKVCLQFLDCPRSAGGGTVLFKHVFLHQRFNVQLIDGAGSGAAALPVLLWHSSPVQKK